MSLDYGAIAKAAADELIPDEVAKRMVFVPQRNRRLNIVSACSQILFPWLHFTFLFWVMCFEWHYQYPALTWCVMLLSFSTGIILAVVARILKVQEADPSWYTFSAGSFFFATTLAVILGQIIFWNYTYWFYVYSELGVHTALNPGKSTGQEIMDGGKFYFTQGSHVDSKRGMGFKHGDMYCVAPVVTNDPASNYDIWAVGMNCCTNPNKFHCGDWGNPYARSGLRSMDTKEHPYYRLAVQQAEAAYGITARNPIFVEFCQDPVDEIAKYLNQGIKYFGMGSLSYFVFNFGFIGYALFLFGRMGRVQLFRDSL